MPTRAMAAALLVVTAVAVSVRAPRPIAVGSAYPARELCSRCGLCDTPFVSEVASACAFIGEGMARIDAQEALSHGRARRLDDAELHFGVFTELSNVRMRTGVDGAAWTGVVTSVAIEALESGLVDAVIAVGAKSDRPHERMEPQPRLCRSAAEVRACRGVKPCLANSLSLLEQVQIDPSIRRLLFIGVGCQVQALRAVEHKLGLEALYVLGTNCADNVRSPTALRRFMEAVSESPESAVGFEFMQDYTVHVKHVPTASAALAEHWPDFSASAGLSPDSPSLPLYERVPVFSLPQAQLKDVIANSCTSCFDYSNALADLVVGYMASPLQPTQLMTDSEQYIVVRNGRGKQLLDGVRAKALFSPVGSGGDRKAFVPGIVEQDLDGLLGVTPPRLWALPRWLGTVMARLLMRLGPTGAEFARSSIDYHLLRNLVLKKEEKNLKSSLNSL